MGEGEEFGRRVLGSATVVRQAAYHFLGRAALSCPEVLAGCPARLAGRSWVASGEDAAAAGRSWRWRLL